MKLDQWGLLTVVACTAVKITPQHWIQGFIRVNLHPKHERSIDVWLSEIAEHLAASSRLLVNGTVSNESFGQTPSPVFVHCTQVLTDLQYIRKKVPVFYAKMTVERQRELLDRVSDKVIIFCLVSEL
jgi:hypothetical protein